MTTLHGDVALLRPLERRDADQMFDLRVRNRRFFAPFEPVATDADFTRPAVLAAIERGIDEDRSGVSYSFGIFDRADGQLAGRIRLTNVFRGVWQNANIGYYVDRQRNGRGLATEAVRLVCGFAFTQADLHRVQAGVMTDNVRSIRVLEKAGLRREGLALRYLLIDGAWRDHFIYAMTAEEYQR